MKRYFAALVFLLATNTIVAGESIGKVEYVIVRASDGLIYFGLKEATVVSKAACQTISYFMIRDENSNAGKQQLAALLAAQASGKTVQVWGMGTCRRWGDGEDVDAIRIQ